MDHLVAVMLLVGCSADGTACAEVPLPTPIYSSIEECRSDLAMQLRFASSSDDRLLGSCAAVDEALLEQSATVEWAVSRGGDLLVEVRRQEDPSLAASPAIDAASTAPISRS